MYSLYESVVCIWENYWSTKKNLFSKERNKTYFSRMENSYFPNLFSQLVRTTFEIKYHLFKLKEEEKTAN